MSKKLSGHQSRYGFRTAAHRRESILDRCGLGTAELTFAVQVSESRTVKLTRTFTPHELANDGQVTLDAKVLIAWRAFYTELRQTEAALGYVDPHPVGRAEKTEHVQADSEEERETRDE